MESKTFETNYLTAVEWLRGDLILCNQVAELDQDLYLAVYDSVCSGDADEDEDLYLDVYQWYLTNYNDRDVDFLREHFGLLFVHSEVLDLWILAVTHWGTSWDYVYWTTDLEAAKRGLGERR